MAEEQCILLPTMEINSAGSTTHQEKEVEEGCSDHASLADTILVLTDSTNASTPTSTTLPTETMDYDRLVIISNKRKEIGIVEDDTIEFLSHSVRKTTNNTYSRNWRKWVTWCFKQDSQLDPEKYDSLIVRNFLGDNKQFSYQHLNDLRSAIASDFRVLHPELPPTADDPHIKQFFKAKKKTEIIIPSINKLTTWNFNILTNYIKKT